MSAARTPHARLLLPAAGIAAWCAPMLIPYSLPPSATVLHQASAWMGWGVLAALALPRRTPVADADTALRALPAALGMTLVVLFALATPIVTGQPPIGAWSIGLTTAAATVLLLAGARIAAAGHAPGEPGRAATASIMVGLAVAGAASCVIAVVQVFAPALADGGLIAEPPQPGRAAGNLRQPNQFSTLLLWSMVAAVWLAESARRAPLRRALRALLVALLFAVVLTASRTGAVGVLLFAAWGAIDRGLSRPARRLLLLAPVAYAAMWFALTFDAQAPTSGVGGAGRLAATDMTDPRVAIWANAIELIRAHPWLGVGIGEFNFAWTLTPFPDRPRQFFDHTHSLPLQLMVEMGVPAAVLVLALLLFGLCRALSTAVRASGPAATSLRCLSVLLLLVALHSLLEYPLWYAHFLLPAALVWGLVLGAPRAAPPRAGTRAELLRPMAVVVAAGGAMMLADYARVVAIFAPPDDAKPLAERILIGQRSWFFAHHADYARVTATIEPRLEMYERPLHHLLDARLMIAWSVTLAANGEVDRARHVARRLAEFGHPQAREFFAPCDKPDPPWQCRPPERSLGWQDFR